MRVACHECFTTCDRREPGSWRNASAEGRSWGGIMRAWRGWKWGQVVGQEKRRRVIIGGSVGCFLLLSLLAMAGDRGFLELRQFNRHLEHLEGRIRALEEENLRVRRQVIGLRNDPYQIERVAREDLGLARPDELIFIILDEHTTTP